MRNGLPSKKLVMVDGNGKPVKRQTQGQNGADDAAQDYAYSSETTSETSLPPPPNTLLVFAAVSLACTAAAVATGSYAIWLGRRQAAQKALTDVNDLLKTCQIRMRQLETEVQNLPSPT